MNVNLQVALSATDTAACVRWAARALRRLAVVVVVIIALRGAAPHALPVLLPAMGR